MSEKAVKLLIKIVLGVMVALVGAGIWYYTMGRKPRVIISAPVKAGERTALIRSVGPNEIVLLAGTKITLYDYKTKKERWTANLSTVAATAPTVPSPVAASPAPAKTVVKTAATPVPEEKPDPLIAARTKKRFAKLEKWAADLNERRTKIKTQLQLDGFNVEAAKYRAELAAAREEAAPLHRTPTVVVPQNSREEDDWNFGDGYSASRVQIVALTTSIWVAQGNRVTALDRADGHVLKSVTLPGNISETARGADDIFVVSLAGRGRLAQVTRLSPAAGAPQSFNVALPPEPRGAERVQGAPTIPSTPERRIVFAANHSSLLEAEVRLVEKKLTERKTMPGEAGSDLEAADKKTTGGFGNDALVYSQALSREAERDATGGKEIIDESAYEITLHRPFAPALPAATAQVHGHPEVFSTPTLDLIVAGKDLVAFDHSNKKLWQTQLAQPISATGRSAWTGENDPASDDEASFARPCLEAGDRLYFFDSAYLSTFARQTGQPAWRLPLRGIRKLQLDSAGHLYVATQAGEFGAFPQLFQLDAKTGRVTWKVEKYDDCFVSGKDIYVSRETRNAEDAVNGVFDRSKAIQCRWKLYKLSGRNGEPQWEWFQTRRPSRIEADHKEVALLFPDELQVLTSIAW